MKKKGTTIMTADIPRRGFLGGAAAFFVAGCRTGGWLAGVPRLRLGVISDTHVTTPESCAMAEKAFRYFRSRGADAVMVPGDITDWGVRSGLEYFKAAWDKVFAGTDVVPLFCTGNHDYNGWLYPDMTMEMHANGYSEDEALTIRLKRGPSTALARRLSRSFPAFAAPSPASPRRSGKSAKKGT